MSVLPAVLFALAAPLASNPVAQEPSVVSITDVYPGEWTIERGSERWLCYRIVDDSSGRPIAAAELFLVPEHKTPLAGAFWSTRSATSDADGFVRVRVDDIEGQWDFQVLRAAGHAVSSRSKLGEPVWRIAAAQDVPVLVRDWSGKPVAGAVIGFCGSCGHGPDLVNATSDARGIAILRGIDPFNEIADLYCQARGLDLGYQPIEWRPGDPPFEFTCAYSTPLTGKLLDHAGNPVAGAFVGVPDVHRGPWAMTRADGTFEVLGAPSDSWLMAHVDGREVHFPEFASIPTVLRLPASKEAFEGTVDDPAPKDRTEPELASIAVRVEGGDERAVVYASAPKYDREKAKDGRVEVPKSGPFVLHVGDRIVRFADVQAVSQQPVVLADYSPTLVRGTVVDSDGRPVHVRANLRVGRDDRGPEMEAPQGQFRLPARASGSALLEIVPEHGDLRARLFYVTLPARGDDAQLDVGRIVLGSEAQLRVLDAKGASRTDVAVRFGRAGYFQVGAEPSFELDADGAWTGPDLRAGDVVLVETLLTESADNEGRIAVPFRTVLVGEGPWTITPPTGVLVLEVSGIESGAHALIADQVFEIGTKNTFAGLPPGPVTMWITAKGRRSAIVTTRVSATGPNAVTVELAPL